MNNLREKQIVRDVIFRKHFDGIRTGIGFSELPADLLPTDFIDIEKVDAFYSENNSWDNHTYLVVYRNRLETDEEHSLLKLDKLKQKSHEARYQQYLKLKEEYEKQFTEYRGITIIIKSDGRYYTLDSFYYSLEDAKSKIDRYLNCSGYMEIDTSKPPSIADVLMNSHELIDEIITASLVRMSEQKRIIWRATKDFISGDITIDLLLDGRPLFNEGYEYEDSGSKKI